MAVPNPQSFAWEPRDALDLQFRDLLRESPEDARARARHCLEREVHDFGRVWLWGQGILAERVCRVLDKAGVAVVGHVSDDEGMRAQFKALGRGADAAMGATMDPSFTAISTRWDRVHLPQLPSWQDELRPCALPFSWVSWRFAEQAHQELFVQTPAEILAKAGELTQAWQLLCDASSRDQLLRRLSQSMGKELPGQSEQAVARALIEERCFPAPLSEHNFGDTSQRYVARDTEWVYDLCDPSDRFCETELSPQQHGRTWRRIAFHPSYAPSASRRPGWLWPRSWIEAGCGAANQQSSAAQLALLERYLKDYTRALGMPDDGEISDHDASVWELLFESDASSPALLRIQGFAWEALCQLSVDKLGDLLEQKPNLELRWETPHAISILASWAQRPKLRGRAWSIERAGHPNLDAVILRRTGR